MISNQVKVRWCSGAFSPKNPKKTYQKTYHSKYLLPNFHHLSSFNLCKNQKNSKCRFAVKKFILGHFLYKNTGARISPQISFESILRLYVAVTSCKKYKSSIYWPLLLPEKPHFGPLLTQKIQNIVISKKITSATFKYLRCRNFRKVPCIGIGQHQKNFILGPFPPKNFKRKLFPTKSLVSILSLYATVTSCQQSEKFHTLTFDNTWKISWPFRAAYGPKTSEKKNFPLK